MSYTSITENIVFYVCGFLSGAYIVYLYLLLYQKNKQIDISYENESVDNSRNNIITFLNKLDNFERKSKKKYLTKK